jgi:hypothetical protein
LLHAAKIFGVRRRLGRISVKGRIRHECFAYYALLHSPPQSLPERQRKTRNIRPEASSFPRPNA